MIIRDLAKNYKQYVIDLRREFHMYPEVGGQEVRTSQRIKEELDGMAIPNVSVAHTGVIATIRGNNGSKTVALRADMDALNIKEANEVNYKSKNDGVCHACGHDGHMAMLLGAARILNDIKDSFYGTVKLIFQPAEEIMTGAKRVIEEDGLDGVDNIFGIHLNGTLPIGMVSVGKGTRMSSADYFSIDVKGKGGHGGMPDLCVDPVVAASSIVMNLQSITSRETSPSEPIVVSVGMFNSGSVFNVIPESARLEGTVRYFNPRIGAVISGVMERIIHHTAKAYRAEAFLTYEKRVPPMTNESGSADRAEKMVANLYGERALVTLPPMTGSEDFSFYQEKIPGVFIFVGAMNAEKGAHYGQHHERFNIDEDALEIGTALHAQYAIDFLNEERS